MILPTLNIAIPYALLIVASVLTLACNSKKLAIVLCAYLVIAVITHRLSIVFALMTVALTAILMWLDSKNKSSYKYLTILYIISLSFLLFLHLIPGVTNWALMKGVHLGEYGSSWNFYLNFDKPLIALVIGIAINLKESIYQNVIKVKPSKILQIGFIWLAIIFFCGMILRFIAFDPKIGSWFIWWAINNLFIVCITEELLFRRFLLARLQSLWGNSKSAGLAALLASSVIFGLFHVGGFDYIVLSTLAGIFYGQVYLKTKNISYSIGAHFILNAIHCLLFSYPRAIL